MSADMSADKVASLSGTSEVTQSDRARLTPPLRAPEPTILTARAGDLVTAFKLASTVLDANSRRGAKDGAAYVIEAGTDGAFVIVRGRQVTVRVPIKDARVRRPGLISINRKRLAESWRHLKGTTSIHIACIHKSEAQDVVVCTADSGAVTNDPAPRVVRFDTRALFEGFSQEGPCQALVLSLALAVAVGFVSTDPAEVRGRFKGVTVRSRCVVASDGVRGVIIRSDALPDVTGWLSPEACKALVPLLHRVRGDASVAVSGGRIQVRSHSTDATVVTTFTEEDLLGKLHSPGSAADLSIEADVAEVDRVMRFLAVGHTRAVGFQLDPTNGRVLVANTGRPGEGGVVPVEGAGATGSPECIPTFPMKDLAIVADGLRGERVWIDFRRLGNQVLVSSRETVLVRRGSGSTKAVTDGIRIDRFVVVPINPSSASLPEPPPRSHVSCVGAPRHEAVGPGCP